MTTSETEIDWSDRPQMTTALIIGAALTITGILGFLLVPGRGQLFGIIGVNPLHNAFHLVTGLFGLAAGYLAGGGFSDEYNKAGGILYLFLFAIWFVIPEVMDELLNYGFPDTILHLGLALPLVIVGFGVADRLG